MDKEYQFALMIDTENVSIKYYEILSKELDALGNVKIKRAYGNFDQLNPWSAKIMDEGIIPMHIGAQVKGKNSADIVLVIDAMETLYSNNVDAFCLVTSDSDFSRLAQKLKEAGMYVVIAGEKKTPASLSKSCHKFIMLDELYNAQNGGDKNSRKDNSDDKEEKRVRMPLILEIKQYVREIIDRDNDDGFALFSIVMDQLNRRYPQFDYKAYGEKNKKDFFKNKLNCSFKKKDKTIDCIKLND